MGIKNINYGAKVCNAMDRAWKYYRTYLHDASQSVGFITIDDAIKFGCEGEGISFNDYYEVVYYFLCWNVREERRNAYR